MKMIKKIYLKKIVSFLLAFFLVFTQNGMKVFANILNNENKLTQSESLNKEDNRCDLDLIYYKCNELLDIVNNALGVDKE